MTVRHALFSFAAVAAIAAAAEAANTVFVTERRIVSSPIEAKARQWDGSVCAAIDVKGQALGAGLSDISINSSSFSEAGLSLCGLPVKNPHTEHFNLDVAMPASWASGRVLTGMDLARTSSGHLAGSLMLELDRPLSGGGLFEAGGGSDGLFFARLDHLEIFSVSGKIDGWAGAFADYRRSDRIDGYLDNGLDSIAFGARTGLGTENWRGEILATGLVRELGVRGAYGTNEKYPAWEDNTFSSVLAFFGYDNGDGQPVDIALLWSRSEDAYWLDRNNHAFYENRHRADSTAVHMRTRRNLAENVHLDARYEAFFESINSRALGDHSRSSGAGAVVPAFSAGNAEFSLGAELSHYSDYPSRLSPLAGVSCAIREKGTIGLSYRESARQPSYTELNYRSPDSLGTAGLPKEIAKTVSADFLYGSRQEGNFAAISVYCSKISHPVDWIKSGAESPWVATDLEDVELAGASFDLSSRAGKDLRLAMGLAASGKDCDLEYYASRYALDYPRFKAHAAADWHLFGDALVLSFREDVRRHSRNPVRRGDSLGMAFSVEASVSPAWLKGMTVSIGAEDLFNDAFEVLPGQKALGRCLYAGARTVW